MTHASRIAISVLAVLTLAAACGDDGNDRAAIDAQNTERALGLAERFRASATTVAEPTVGGGDVEVATSTATGTAAAPSTAPPVEPTGVVVPVAALDNSFRPEVVEIAVGDEVVWENRGINDHDVLYVDGDDWGVEVEGFGPGAVYAHVFTEPGEYRYYCSIHGNESVGMVGVVIVNG